VKRLIPILFLLTACATATAPPASNDAEPYARGTTTFDLVHRGDAWKIASIVTQ
jgi:hypothetical protein